VIAACLAAPAGAAAQATPPAAAAPEGAPGGARVEEAQRRVTAAMAAFRAHDYTTAIHEFELAWRAAPNPDLWYNLARARELSGDSGGAIGDYQRYLRDKVDPPDRAEVERHIRELQSLADLQAAARRRQAEGSRIRFHVEGGGDRAARWFLDGREVPAAGDGLGVAPGEHAVRYEAPAMQEWTARVRVREGETATVFAAPALATRYATRPTPHVASLALGGLGAVALGVAGYLAVRAASTDCNGCEERVTASNRSDILLGVGAGLAVGAVVAYFIERATGRTERVAASP
jgi:hypothetical protein